MSRYGARIYNRATGAVQVDDLYANLALISKQTVTTGALGTSLTSSVDVMITSTNMPIIAISCTVPTAVYSVTRNSGANTWTFTIIAEGASRSIVVYVFNEPPVLGSGWGFRIKRDGQVKFDNRHRYVRRAARMVGTFDPTQEHGTAGPSGSAAVGPTYAYIMGNTAKIYQAVNPQPQVTLFRRRTLCLAINGGSFTSKYIENSFSQSNAQPISFARGQGQYSWAFIDVTGY